MSLTSLSFFIIFNYWNSYGVFGNFFLLFFFLKQLLSLTQKQKKIHVVRSTWRTVPTGFSLSSWVPFDAAVQHWGSSPWKHELLHCLASERRRRCKDLLIEQISETFKFLFFPRLLQNTAAAFLGQHYRSQERRSNRDYCRFSLKNVVDFQNQNSLKTCNTRSTSSKAELCPEKTNCPWIRIKRMAGMLY